MKHSRSFIALLVLASVLVLSACGFKLRGSGSFPSDTMPFKTIFIDFSDQSELGIMLRRYLRSNRDIKIVNNPKEAEVILSNLSDSRTREVLSLNSQGRVREFSLLYTLRFQIKDNKGAFLLEPTEITLRRTLTYNESEALSKESEERMLYRDMDSDMAQRIIRRLAALKMPGDLSSEKPVDISPETKSEKASSVN